MALDTVSNAHQSPAMPPARRRDAVGPSAKALGNGRYELCEFVSKGGMGAVYRARDVELDRWVAVKCLLDVARVGARELAVKEAKTLASLSHPNIMRVFDILAVGSQIWIVSEWLEGHCLAQLPLPLPPPTVLAVMTQIYDALAAAHAAQVIHRDIKPANVMVGNDGRVTLIDFGVAFAPGSSTGETMAGSLRYTDPRTLEGEPPDAMSDLFSAALLQIELMTGETVLPDLAPLPLYRHIKKNLEGRLDSMLDGVYPPLAAMARKYTLEAPGLARYAMVEKTVATRDAAAIAHALLQRLTPKAPQQYLAEGLCHGSTGDAAAQQLIADETDAALASALLTPKQKAAWIAFKACADGKDKGKTKEERRAVTRRLARERLANLKAEAARRRSLVATIGLATFVLALMFFWMQAAQESGLKTPSHRADHSLAERPHDLAPGQERPTSPSSLEDAEVPLSATERLDGAPSSTPAPDRAATMGGPAKVPVYLVADAWAIVAVDGREVGRLPQAAPFMLPPGRHELTLTSPSVEPLKTEIEVEAGKAARLHFHLIPKTTTRKLSLAKPGRLFVNGHDLGVVTSTTVSLPYGTHEIKIVRGGRARPPKSIALGPNSPAVIALE